MKQAATISSIIYVLVFGICSWSCIDKDLAQLDSQLKYTADFALPIGSYSIKLSDYIPENEMAVDTTNFSDSLIVIYYNDKFIEGEIEYDSTFRYELELSSIENYLDKTDFFIFRLNCKNSVPGVLSMQAYFADNLGNYIDSAFTEAVRINAAEINSDGEVSKIAEHWKIDSETFDSERIQDIAYASYLMVEVKLRVEDYREQQIIYQSAQDIWIQMGFQVGVNIGAPDE